MKTQFANALGFVLIFAVGLSVVQTRAATETRTVDVENFDKVEIHGHHELTLTQGNEESLTYYADEEWIDEVIVENRNGLLQVSLEERKGWNWGGDKRKVVFELHVKNLSDITTHGASTMELGDFETDNVLEIRNHGSSILTAKRIKAEDLKLQFHGSGKLTIAELEVNELSVSAQGPGNFVFEKTTADEIEMMVHGAGDINFKEGSVDDLEVNAHGAINFSARDLVAKNADVKLFGAGGITVNVKNELDVVIQGAGDVTYYGNPSVDKSIHGFGSINAAQ